MFFWFSVIDEDDVTETSDLSINSPDSYENGTLDTTSEALHSELGGSQSAKPQTIPPVPNVTYCPADEDENVSSANHNTEYEVTGSLIDPAQMNSMLNGHSDATDNLIGQADVSGHVHNETTPVVGGNNIDDFIGQQTLRRRVKATDDYIDINTPHDVHVGCAVGSGGIKGAVAQAQSDDAMLNSDRLTTDRFASRLKPLSYEQDHPSSCESEETDVNLKSANMQVY